MNDYTVVIKGWTWSATKLSSGNYDAQLILRGPKCTKKISTTQLHPQQQPKPQFPLLSWQEWYLVWSSFAHLLQGSTWAFRDALLQSLVKIVVRNTNLQYQACAVFVQLKITGSGWHQKPCTFKLQMVAHAAHHMLKVRDNHTTHGMLSQLGPSIKQSII